MRWRPLTWFLLSVLFFVGAGYFWHLGEKWRIAKERRAPGQATNHVAPPAPQAKPTAQNVERGSVERLSVTNQSAILAAAQSLEFTNHESRITNQFPYRLT